MTDSEQVYYDPKAQLVFTVKRKFRQSVVIGGCGSPYLSDAKTSYMRYKITKDYFEGCQPIDESSHLLQKDREGYRLRDNNQQAKVRKSPDYEYLQKESEKLIKAGRDLYDPPGFF